MWEERNPYHAPTAREVKWCGYCIVRVGFYRWSTELNVDDDIIEEEMPIRKNKLLSRTTSACLEARVGGKQVQLVNLTSTWYKICSQGNRTVVCWWMYPVGGKF